MFQLGSCELFVDVYAFTLPFGLGMVVSSCCCMIFDCRVKLDRYVIEEFIERELG